MPQDNWTARHVGKVRKAFEEKDRRQDVKESRRARQSREASKGRPPRQRDWDATEHDDAIAGGLERTRAQRPARAPL
ncbi:MAG: hypothetical protein FJ318_08560, partial [SAR202 cluster bacterium]|nr:hypothetical protein [SAR202 cluster bacterium]